MLPYRWIPKDSEVIAHPLGVVYTYQAGPRVAAVAYVGKANKASWHHSFIGRDPIAARAQKIQEFFSGLEASAKLKADRRAERNKPHDLQVGDIVINSWGWEQTNIDAYEVVGTSANYVSLQRVNR